MKATLKFHKALRRFTDGIDSITVDAASYYDLVIAAINLFPDLENYFKKTYKNGLKEELLLVKNKKVIQMQDIYFSAKEPVTLVPAIFGSGGKGGLIAGLALVALVAVSFFTGGAGILAASSVTQVSAGTIALGTAGTTVTSLTLAGKLVLGIGANLILSSLAPKPKTNSNEQTTPDSGARLENNNFGSLANSTDSRTAVGMIYGLHRMSGQFISGYTKTRNHGKNEVINVGEEFE